MLQTTSQTFDQPIESPQTPQSLNSHPRATSRSSSYSAKRKKNDQEKAIERICNTLEQESDEFDSVGANVAHKLRKMDSEQQVFAEFLINNILLLGIQKKLCNDSHVCQISSHLGNTVLSMASNFPLRQPQYNQQQQAFVTPSQLISTNQQQTFALSQPTNQQQKTFLSTQSMDTERINFDRNIEDVYTLVETSNVANEDNGNTTTVLPGSMTELLIFKNK